MPASNSLTDSLQPPQTGMTLRLIELCRWLEPLIRPYGWHCAATGSALYGLSDHNPEDLDVMLYRHNGWEKQPRRAYAALSEGAGLKLQDLTEYSDFQTGAQGATRNRRKVYRVTFKTTENVLNIDFLCIDEMDNTPSKPAGLDYP